METSRPPLRQSCQTALFLRDGHADFYENIDDGIDAYKAYIREQRPNEMTKKGTRSGSEMLKAKRKERRKIRKEKLKNGDNAPDQAPHPPQ